MPQLPTYTAQTDPRGGVSSPTANPAAFGAGLARAISRAGNALTQYEDQQAHSWALRSMAQFRLQQARALQRTRKQTPLDAPDIILSALDAFDKAAAELEADAPNSRARELVGNSLATFRSNYGQQALAYDVQRNLARRSNDAEEAIRLGQAALMHDPSQLPEVLQDTLTGIKALALPGPQKEELLQKADKALNGTVLWGAIKIDPDGAIQRLVQGDFPTLEPDDRQMWVDAALRESERQRQMRLSEEDRLRREADRAQKQAEEETFKDGRRLLAEGQMTPAWIEAHRDDLSGAKYDFFYQAMTGDKIQTVPEVYAPLRMAVSRGEDVRQRAEDQYLTRNIGQDDYDRLLSVAEEHTPGQQLPSWFKRGEKYISAAMRPNDLNPTAGQTIRLANGMDEWFEWAAKHKDATEKEAVTAFKSIVDSYAIVESKDFYITLKKPRYLVGDRNSPTAETLDATEAATLGALANGELTQKEAEEEALRIAEWRHALSKLQAREGNNATTP